MKRALNRSMPTAEAEKAYTKLEAERIRIEIARFGSEGLCPHCTHRNACGFSTTTVRLGCSLIECDGYDIAVSHDKTFRTKMEYSFDYDEKKIKTNGDMVE